MAALRGNLSLLPAVVARFPCVIRSAAPLPLLPLRYNRRRSPPLHQLRGFASPLGDRGKAKEDEYFRRAELELLEKLRKRLAAEQAASEGGQQAEGADGPRKASKSGSSPLGDRGKAKEDEYFRRAELELLEKLRKRLAAEQAASEGGQQAEGADGPRKAN
jgi:hypothetical protein